MLRLLHECQTEDLTNREAIRHMSLETQAAIEAVRERDQEIDSLGEEITSIRAKAATSAGNSAELEAVLKGELAEASSLAAETARLAAQLTESMAALEQLHVRSAQAELDMAVELPKLRCAFRKRTREGYSNALRYSCSLLTLENELDSTKRQIITNHVVV